MQRRGGTCREQGAAAPRVLLFVPARTIEEDGITHLAQAVLCPSALQITTSPAVRAEMSEAPPAHPPPRHTPQVVTCPAHSALGNKPSLVGTTHQVLKIRKRAQESEASSALFSSNSGRFLAAIQPNNLWKWSVNHDPCFFTVEETKLLSPTCLPKPLNNLCLRGCSFLTANPARGLTLSTLAKPNQLSVGVTSYYSKSIHTLWPTSCL